jgi:serine/threonine-protein kinase
MEPVEPARVFSGRYELTHLIARGGMAQVYRSRDRLLDRPVALKVLFPELSVDRSFVERFRREAQAAANLSHPNIVPVFDWGEDSGTYFIVMEFVDGRPLSAVLRDGGPMAPRQAASIGANVASALAYAHRHGVVHRDVKPGNVLITGDGQVKVTDFGIARAVNTDESLTQTGAVMGTAAYFSPEQAEGFGVDARSDIYSLGVVLFEMVTGRTPFVGDSPVAVASKHVRDLPPLPRQLNPTVPVELEAVVMKAMAKSPDDRYADADALRADLLRFADGRPVAAEDPAATLAMSAARTGTMTAMATSPFGVLGTQTLPTSTNGGAPPDEEANRRRTRRLVALLVALLVLLLVVVFFLLRAFGVVGASGAFTLPNLVGKTLPAATATLHEDGLDLGTVTHQPSSQAKDIVVASAPAGGDQVHKGDTVDLTVSSGPAAQVTVPNVIGQTLLDAESKLQAAHLNFQIHAVSSQSGSVDTVLDQNPKGGEKVRAGTSVLLTVPQAASTVLVPNVAGETPDQAANQLGAAGLQVGPQTSQCSGTVGSGQVVSTNPAGGTQAPRNSSVALVVSSGPCQVSVPNVVGATQGNATASLRAQGLGVSVATSANCSPAADGTVLSQNPSGGNQVNAGSSVTITVCSLSTTTTTTTAPPPTSTTTSSSTTTTTGP